MPRFNVTISRTELITFQLEAVDEDDALEHYWEGEETAAKTTDITVENVTEETDA